MRTIATEYTQRILADLAGWMERRRHAWLEPPAFQRLSELHVPTLIVIGQPLELGAQQSVDAVSRALAGAKVVTMPAESNLINMDQPDVFNRIVLGFLNAINRAPKQ